MLKIAKCPLVDEGSKDIHRRLHFGQETVSEQGYFTRYAGINAKTEVQR